MVEVNRTIDKKSVGRHKPLSVGEVATRAGVAVSAIHFYERKGLIQSFRNAGNQRRFHRGVLRRIAVIRVGQRAGMPLSTIREALAGLPSERTPNADDWRKLSSGWRDELDRRIEALAQLRDQLAGCIGCGCLSIRECPLSNPGDRLGSEGPGARLLELLP